MATFSKAIFESLVNQVFTLYTGDNRTITLLLESITSSHISDLFESFTLNFEPPANEAPLPDGSYLMENENLGQAVIFISATHAGVPDPQRYYYESVFNVLVEEPSLSSPLDGSKG